MPNVLAAVRTILLADPDVAASVGTRIHPGQLPQDATKPSICLWTVSSEAYDCLDGGIGMETPRIRVEVISDSRETSDSIWLECNAALSRNFTPGTYAGTFVRAIGQSGGHFHLEDRPYDGSGRWLYRTIQSYQVTYHLFER